MTYYVIYNGNSGTLLDILDGPPSTVESGLVIKSFDGSVPDLYYYNWDSNSCDFVLRADVSRLITIHEFLNRFTAQERIRIKDAAKIDSALSDYMDMLYQATGVDLSDQLLYGGLMYLVYLGLLDQSRISEILA